LVNLFGLNLNALYQIEDIFKRKLNFDTIVILKKLLIIHKLLNI